MELTKHLCCGTRASQFKIMKLYVSFLAGTHGGLFLLYMCNWLGQVSCLNTYRFQNLHFAHLFSPFLPLFVIRIIISLLWESSDEVKIFFLGVCCLTSFLDRCSGGLASSQVSLF